MKTRRVSVGARRRLAALERLRPRDAEQLHRFVELILGLRVPRRALVAGNDGPFEYLVHVFFEGAKTQAAGREGQAYEEQVSADVVVWANRGGGKTLLGAAATMLDLLFKPGIQVRILAGSLEQASKMYEYLLGLARRPMLRGVLAGEPSQRRLTLINGSRATVSPQSPQAVRGQHVHKLRCDEVDLLDRRIWQAAQMVPLSGVLRGRKVRGAVEALSTMHQPFGIMSDLTAPGRHVRVLRWSALDVAERCPPQRACATCPIESDCGGLAKQAEGFLAIDDLIEHRRRTSDETWEAEQMCRRPRREALVYRRFRPEIHVRDTGPGGGGSQLVAATRTGHRNVQELSARLALQSAGLIDEHDLLVAGMDFGLRSPLVMLWARLPEHGGDMYDQPIHIVDEYAEEGLTLEQNLERITARGWPKPAWIGVDPAGGQRNSHTGMTDIQVLRRMGYKVRAKRCAIPASIEIVRRRLDRGTLVINPSCPRLIKALQTYHFDPERPQSLTPVKDGPDHLCDALRYLVVNFELGPQPAADHGYW